MVGPKQTNKRPHKIQQLHFFWYLCEENKNTKLKEYMHHPYVHCSIITTAKTWKKFKCSQIDEWIKKKWHINTMDYYSALKKNEILTFLTVGMNLQDNMLKWNKPERQRQRLHHFTYTWNLKSKTNEQNQIKYKKTATKSKIQRIAANQREGWGMSEISERE